jgi:hypothetical protein
VPLKILRPIFGRTTDGVWAIESLAAIPLEAEDRQDADFYPVREDLFTVQPNYIGTIRSTMGQSIVPVVAIFPGEDLIRCLGSGFFVSCTGLLITAAHVITDPIERSYGDVRKIDDQNWYMGDLNLGVMIGTNPIFQPKGYLFRPIEWAGFLGARTEHPLPIRGADLRLTSDTAICKVAMMSDGTPYQPLSIIQPGIRGVGLAVGKTATAIGYAGMQDVELLPEKNRVRPGEFRFNLHVSKGEVLERFPDNGVNRQVSTPGACFSASLKLPGGMSGSPIFDDERIYVHGVVSRGLEDENGPTDLGYGSMLATSLALPIKPLEGKSLLDLMKAGGHGIPRINISGA